MYKSMASVHSVSVMGSSGEPGLREHTGNLDYALAVYSYSSGSIEDFKSGFKNNFRQTSSTGSSLEYIGGLVNCQGVSDESIAILYKHIKGLPKDEFIEHLSNNVYFKISEMECKAEGFRRVLGETVSIKAASKAVANRVLSLASLFPLYAKAFISRG